jgi:NAD+ kinase
VAEVLLVVHRARPEAPALAAAIARSLADDGHRVLLPEPHVEVEPAVEHQIRRDLDELDLERWCPGEPLDLVVSLGGDGTVLRCVELCAGAAVPILGVNLGQLGYLTEVEPDGVGEALSAFFANEHQIERRMLLEVLVDGAHGAPFPNRVLALNEATLDKTLTGHTIRVEVSIDGVPFTPYEADAMIVATPTGSTAHAFSARGPIVAPTHRLVLLTPVSPHMLFDRTLVLEPDVSLRLEVAGHRDAALVVDGRLLGLVSPGASITCRAASEQAHLVTFGPRQFTQILKGKFKLSDR